MEGRDLQSVLEAVQKKRLKRREPAKHEELKEWIWRFTMHVAHGLAQVCSRSVLATPQMSTAKHSVFTLVLLHRRVCHMMSWLWHQHALLHH